jgi:hypothetical protein
MMAPVHMMQLFRTFISLLWLGLQVCRVLWKTYLQLAFTNFGTPVSQNGLLFYPEIKHLLTIIEGRMSASP